MNLKKYLKNLDNYTFYPITITIIYILIYNLLHYNPIEGYDGEAHHAYVQNFLNLYVPNKIDQPASNLTNEFFSPPLPYLLPAAINEVCKQITNYNLQFCQEIYGATNIFFQSLIYILTIFIYLRIFKNLNIGNQKNTLLILLVGILTVNYKSISMIRAETYVFFFCSLLIYFLVKLFQKNFLFNRTDIIKFGLVIGAIALSRQWGFLLFPGLFFLLIYIDKNRFSYFKFLAYSFTIGFIISAWFYFNLFFEYGSFTAFNLESRNFSFKNQPISFYLPSLNDIYTIFSKPIRPSLDNKFIPILYSDLWGDYWGYFSFTSRKLEIGRNQLLIGDYLARVNIVSIVPSFIFVFAFIKNLIRIKSKVKDPYYYLNLYVTTTIITIFVGFLWFTISYPVASGDTIKSTYVIHLFQLLSISATMYLFRIKKKSTNFYGLIYILLLFAFFHNMSAMTSHFPMINLISFL